MALDAGSVFVTLGGRFSPAGFSAFGAATTRAKVQMEQAEAGIASSSRRSTAAVGAMGAAAKGGALAGVAALGAGLYSAAKVAIDFEKSMRNVNSIAGLSEPRFKALSKSVLSLSGETAQAPKTLAEGMYQLVSSGFDADESMTILKSSAKAASAGLTDTETATTAVAAALNSYHLKADDAAKVSDILFQTVNRGVISFPELAQTIGTVLPFASSLHVGLNQVGASISTLTKEGIPAAEATTYLKNAMVQFLKPSDALAESIHKAGYESGESLVKAKGFQGALNAVAAETDGTKGALQKMFPDIRASAAVFALTGKNASTAADDLRNFRAAATTGATQKVFEEQSKSVSFQLRQLKANMSVLGVEVGTALLPSINSIVSAMSRFVGQMNSGTGAGGHFVATLRSDLDGLLGVMTTVGRALSTLLKGFNLIPFAPDIDVSGLDRGLDKMDKFRESLRRPFGAKVTADVQSAIDQINKVDAKGIKPKLARILASGDTTVKQKIAQIQALGFSPKAARIIATGVPQTLADVAAVRAALGSLPASKTVTLTTINRIINQGSSVSKTPPVGGLKKRRAAGRGAGGAETALVGEGRGPELVGNQDRGWTWVTQPTVMGLAAGDYVIPTDPQYSGRALGLMLGMLGVPGYAKGRPAKKSSAKKAPASKPLPIPPAIQFGSVPEDDLNNQKDHARDAYQKRKARVHDLDVAIREDRKKVAGAKGAAAKRKAREKLAADQRDRKRYADGGDGLDSLAVMRAKWQELSKQATVLHKTNQEIERLNTIQETDRAKMENAAKRGDPTAWTMAKKDRDSVLSRLKQAYALALKYARPDSNFAAELEGKLASVEGDIADQDTATFDAPSPFDDSGLTKDEKKRLDQLQANQSLAALTPELADDQAAAKATEQYLTGLLGAALSDPARGGASVIGALADQVKQARDNVASFTSGGAGGSVNDNQDVQAQIQQANARADAAERAAQVSSLALSVFQGAGDIGTAPMIQNNYMLHPADPGVLRAIGDASVAGMSLQPYVTSTRSTVG
jgi:TP901 family phage tail tape measure protein